MNSVLQVDLWQQCLSRVYATQLSCELATTLSTKASSELRVHIGDQLLRTAEESFK